MNRVTYLLGTVDGGMQESIYPANLSFQPTLSLTAQDNSPVQLQPVQLQEEKQSSITDLLYNCFLFETQSKV